MDLIPIKNGHVVEIENPLDHDGSWAISCRNYIAVKVCSGCDKDLKLLICSMNTVIVRPEHETLSNCQNIRNREFCYYVFKADESFYQNSIFTSNISILCDPKNIFPADGCEMRGIRYVREGHWDRCSAFPPYIYYTLHSKVSLGEISGRPFVIKSFSNEGVLLVKDDDGVLIRKKNSKVERISNFYGGKSVKETGVYFYPDSRSRFFLSMDDISSMKKIKESFLKKGLCIYTNSLENFMYFFDSLKKID